ncbi:MAG TPA: alpha-1,2-fucosyltransferase [Planctomycetota bacterium]|nr:alpha-1,2-fucosyltransferase [Planctomycetota bacterium]
MILARVEGGLGNQLFIYAAARALALRSGTQLRLDVLNSYPRDRFGRRYQLDEFNIAAALAMEAEVARYRPESRGFYWRRKLDRRLPFSWRSIIEERSLFEPRLLDLRPHGDVYLMGYWQREEYFRGQAPAIRRELTLRREPSAQNAALAERMRQCESAFLHVRRTGYAHRLSPGYYAAALELLYKRAEEPRLFVFGDDLDWARRELPLPEGTQFVEHNGEDRNVEDLWLMTRCRHAILANSSFSWWGAWLNTEPDRVVIAPATWGYRAAAASGWLTVDG